MKLTEAVDPDPAEALLAPPPPAGGGSSAGSDCAPSCTNVYNVDVTPHAVPSNAAPVPTVSGGKASEVALCATGDQLDQILRETPSPFGGRAAAYRKVVSSDVDDDAHLIVVTNDRVIRHSSVYSTMIP